jgi:hypothetical protein
MILHATNSQLQSNKFETNKYEVSKSQEYKQLFCWVMKRQNAENNY